MISQKELLDQGRILHYQKKLQYEIDSWDLHQSIEKGEDILVIDARSQASYQKEHIPKSINFPHSTINKDSVLKRLDLETLYVTYCDGIGCNASTKGALKLAELGYKVKELIGGLDWWKRDGYNTASSPQGTASTVTCGCDG